eukprot:COSAG01_NODE_975_length_12366_cov_20.561833_15_plen_48_part_00
MRVVVTAPPPLPPAGAALRGAVRWRTRDGTASAGEHFTGVSGGELLP